MFIVGELYNRRKDIHEPLGGQQQGGICTPNRHPFVFIFTGKEGSAYGYKDGWNEEGLFLYTGEGQVGDQRLERGNKAILEHQLNGKELLLFQKEYGGFSRFLGHMACIGYHEEQKPDRDGNNRKALVFELVAIENASILKYGHEISERISKVSEILSLEELFAKATDGVPARSTVKERKTNYYQRSEYVRLYALRKAEGKCQGCSKEAPFQNKKGEPYLEVHHIKRLSDGGPDDPRWVIALCPNCHSRIHNGSDGNEFNDTLKNLVG